MSHHQTDLLGTDHSDDAHTRRTITQRVVSLGLVANIVLAVTKLSGGIFGHSQGLLADGINSISDVVYFLVVRFFVALSAKPADEEHPYGHQQYESIAALVVGAFVITTGISIFWNSVQTAYGIVSGSNGAAPVRMYALLIAFGTILIKTALMLHARKITTRTGSLAVSALARDHRNDIWASAGAALGILPGLLGYRIWDPIAGALVAVVVVKTGIDIIRESAHELMDTIPGRDIDDHVRSVVTRVPRVESVEEVHAHRFGPYLVLNLTIGVEGSLSVAQGEEIAHTAEQHLYDTIEKLRRVYIHFHPARQ